MYPLIKRKDGKERKKNKMNRKKKEDREKGRKCVNHVRNL